MFKSQVKGILNLKTNSTIIESRKETIDILVTPNMLKIERKKIA